MIETNSGTFHSDIATGNVLVEIFNPGCPPCEAMKKDILPGVEDRIKVVTLNASLNMSVISGLQEKVGSIMSVPVLLLFRGGRFIKRHDGMMTADELADFISE